MFLDEELEAIFKDEDGITESKSLRLFQACLKRIPKPNQVRPQDFLNEIRKIEGGWKLFCKRHLDGIGLIPKGLALEAPEGMYKEK